MSTISSNPVVAELQKAGAPQSQIDNAIQMAKDAPEQPGAGVPYDYPDTTKVKEEPKEPEE
jgi:hypothetical protein